MAAGAVLARGFYDRPVVDVARALIGCVLHAGECSGVIVETEAYHHDEPASHAYVGLTARTQTLFSEPGIAYVYRSYGIHALLNAVAEGPHVGAAVLLRALEPREGIELMRLRRGVVREQDLCSGPGKLTQALDVELEVNGTSLIRGPVRILAPDRGAPARPLVAGPRIGITKAVDLPWRFCAADSRCLSRPAGGGPASLSRSGR